MRVLHFNYIPRLSGAESLATELALRHARSGVASGIAAFAPPEPSFAAAVDRLRRGGVEVLFPERALSAISRILWVRRVCASFEPDVVAAHSVIPSAYVRSALFARNRPYIVSVLHSASEDDYQDIRFRVPELILNRRAAAIVTVSPMAQQRYASRVGRRMPIQTIANGIDVERVASARSLRERCRTEMRVQPHTRVILQVGRFGQIKNQASTLAALAEALKRGSAPTRLWLAGIEEDAAYLRTLRELCHTLQIQEDVVFLGPRSDIPELLAAADVFAMPSRQEGHSVALLEALASGIPIVASAIAPFEFARRYPSVHLIAAVDTAGYSGALMTALQAQRVSRDVSEYSIDRTAFEYLRVFNKITGG